MRGIRRLVGLVVVSAAVALSGIGAAHADPGADAPGIELTPSNADFGDVPLSSPYGGGTYTPSTRTFTVTSTGTSDLLVGSPSLTGADPGQFYVSRNTCQTSVAPGSACEIDVTVIPWFSLGAQAATLVVPSNAPDGPRTASLTATLVPLIVTTKLTADPVTLNLGALGAVRLTPRATLTDAATGKPLPLLGLGDTGREVVFTVNGKTVCTAVASPANGVASCQGLVPLLSVLLAGGYDAHFDAFSHWGVSFLPSTARGPLIG